MTSGLFSALSRFCLFFSKAPTKQAPWSDELCKCAAKRYLAKWNIDRSVTRGPSGLIAEDSYITMSVFESLLLSETCTIVERGGWEFCSRNELIVRLVWHRLKITVVDILILYFSQWGHILGQKQV